MCAVFFSFFLWKCLEHGLQTTLPHPPTINNNNSSINNNNHSTKSGTNSTKLPPAAVTVAAANDDHQPLIATIHRNGKSSAASIANKAVAVPQVKSKSTGKSLTNDELNENLIEFSISDSIDGNSSSGDQTALSIGSLIPDSAKRNFNQQQLQKSTPADLNVIRANKTIVALSILIQHLTTNVSIVVAISLRFSFSFTFNIRICTRMNYSIIGFCNFSSIFQIEIPKSYSVQAIDVCFRC